MRILFSCLLGLMDMVSLCHAQSLVFETPPHVPVPGGVTDFGNIIFLESLTAAPGFGVLTQPNEELHVAVTGSFSDDSAADITLDPNTIYESSSDVASLAILQKGLVSARLSRS